MLRGGGESGHVKIPHGGWSIHVPDHAHKTGHRIRNKHICEAQSKTDCLPLEWYRTPIPIRGTEDLRLYYRNDTKGEIMGYADSGFKTDEVSGKSQIGYVFIKNGAPISWKSAKQTVTATFTNHAELLAFHEASMEAVWLRTMQEILAKQCKMNQKFKPTVIFEDNATCVTQMNTSFIKADRVKHISPHIFGFAQNLIETGQIETKKIKSEINIADMLTKALPAYKHRKLVEKAKMKTLHELAST